MSELIISSQTLKQYQEWVKQYTETYATGTPDGLDISTTCFLLEQSRCPFPIRDCTQCAPAQETLELIHKEAQKIVLNNNLGAEIGKRGSHTLILQKTLRTSSSINPILETTVYDGNGISGAQKVNIKVYN
jgi:hypothetical protein